MLGGRPAIKKKGKSMNELEMFIKQIWNIFPDQNEFFHGPKALIFYGSKKPDEIIQVLEEFFEKSVDAISGIGG